MDKFTTMIAQAIAEGHDLKSVFKKQVETALNMLMESERTLFLGYEPWDPEGYHSGNARNGYYKRILKTELGELEVSIPRDRLGMFKQQTLDSYMLNQDSLEHSIILLYKKGITTREISDLIEKMYGHYYSPQTVSNLSNIVEEEIALFHNRPIKHRYVALFCDATFINVRRDTVAKEAVHIIIGIDSEGHKEVLDFNLYPTESATNYCEMLADLKSRGLEEVLIFVSDELTGLSEALTDSFPKARHQSCWTHILRNIANKVRPRDKAEVLEDLKPVYRAKNKEQAKILLQEFANKWGSIYPKAMDSLVNKNNLFTFMDFPESVRPTLYTNNVSESFNKQLKRKTKVKEQFPNEVSLEKAVYCYVSEYNAKFSHRIHKGFGLARFLIEKLFEEAYGKTLEQRDKASPPVRNSEPLRIVS